MESAEFPEQVPPSKRRYLELLGTDEIPKDPSELPSEFQIPSGVSGRFEELILESLGDGLERSFDVAVSPSGEYILGNSYRGSSNQESFRSTASRLRKTMGRSRNRLLMAFHTHPVDTLSLFSTRDIELIIAESSSAFMNLVGSNLGIYALLSTQKSESHGKSRVSDFFVGTLRGLKVEKRLREGIFGYGHVEDSAALLEQEGFGLYRWKTRSQFSVFGLEKGEMQNGITFKRVPTTRASHDRQ